jgi:hypothetical protein
MLSSIVLVAVLVAAASGESTPLRQQTLTHHSIMHLVLLLRVSLLNELL